MRETESVTVSIYGQEYTLKGGDDCEYVQKVAKFVDERMMEVAGISSGNASVTSTAKVAILAAVNIADELFREQQKRLESMVTLEDRSLQLTRLLGQEILSNDISPDGPDKKSLSDGKDSLPGT